MTNRLSEGRFSIFASLSRRTISRALDSYLRVLKAFEAFYNKIPWFVSNIWCLELMSFSGIFLEDPQNSMKRDKIQVIATEWRRKFPRLRGMPCPADIYSTYMQEDDSDEASAGERASVMKRCQTGVKNQETELA